MLDNFKKNIPADNDVERKANVLKLAAQYIREDIRGVETEMQYYPSVTDFFADDNITKIIPKSLKSFLEQIIMPNKKDIANTQRKIISICHAIMSATRPTSFISTLQLATSLYLHTEYQLKTVIQLLHRLGLCASYEGTILYEKSAVMSSTPIVQPSENSFIQFVIDNADYDVRTIDGKNTFHYTGAIECITPDSSVELSLEIERLTSLPSAAAIAAKHRVKVFDYEVPESRGLPLIEIADIRKLRPLLPEKTYFLPGEIMWFCGHWLKIPNHMGWSGFMELRTESNSFEKTKIKYLPFIFLKATDNSAIYTAMLLGIKEAKKIGQENIFLTFDQQLYIKAREILADIQHGKVHCDENMNNVFIRLGGFHLLMSFLACIGKVMDGSGLKEVWTEIYAEKSTEKMLTGKNYARSIRANFLTQAALFDIILEECSFTIDERRQMLAALLHESQDIQSKETLLDQLQRLPVIHVFTEKMKNKLYSISERGKTATLWVQYTKMVSLARSFIQAERTGDFNLHLSTIIEMMPFFHSCRHFNYAKSAQLYVQDMLELKTKMTSVSEYNKFINQEFFTIRRSNKFFSGTSTDMVIEQSLMRSIHSIGGLSRGRGITESVATSWLNSLTCCTYVNDDFEDFCKLHRTSSEQHKDSRDSNIVRDEKDLQKLIQWFKSHSPFPSNQSLCNIATGMSGGPDVNCHEAESLGIRSVQKISPRVEILETGEIITIKENFANVKFDKDLQITPLSVSNGSIRIDDIKVPVDNKMLFDRFKHSQPKEEDFPKFFEYEICPYPLSLFESFTKIRHSQEDVFAIFKKCQPPPTNDNNYIIDGETLLTAVTWPKSCTYQAVYESYISFIVTNFAEKRLQTIQSRRRCLYLQVLTFVLKSILTQPNQSRKHETSYFQITKINLSLLINSHKLSEFLESKFSKLMSTLKKQLSILHVNLGNQRVTTLSIRKM